VFFLGFFFLEPEKRDIEKRSLSFPKAKNRQPETGNGRPAPAYPTGQNESADRDGDPDRRLVCL